MMMFVSGTKICENEKCQRSWVVSPYQRVCPFCEWDPSKIERNDDDMGKRKRGKRKNQRPAGVSPGAKATNYRNPHGYAVAAVDSGWEVEIDTIESCSKAPANVKVKIQLLAKEKINALMKKYPKIEWLAYLLGDKENDPHNVTDIHVPTQEVTSVRVDKIDCPEFNDLGVIGVIHSHHGMGNGFSGVDHEWINQNHDISLCISHGGIAGQVRWKTPCGGLKIVPAAVKVVYPASGFDTEGWVEEECKKITEKAGYGTSYSYANQGSYFTGQGYQQPGRSVPRTGNGVAGNVPPAGQTGGSKVGGTKAEQYKTGFSPGSGEVINVGNKKDDDDSWESGLASDDAPEEDEMSLVEALKELDDKNTGTETAVV